MKKLVLMGLLVVSGYMQAAEVMPIEPIEKITQEDIKQEQARLEKLLYRHQLALYVFGGVAAAGAGLVVYKVGKEVVKESYIVGSAITKWFRKKLGYYTPEEGAVTMISKTAEAWKAEEKDIETLARIKVFSKIDKNSAGKYKFNILSQYYNGEIKAPLLERMMHGTANFVKNIGSFTVGGVVVLSPIIAKAALVATMNHIRTYFAHGDSLPWYIGYEANYIKYSDGIIHAVQPKEIDGKQVIIQKETLTDEEVVILEAIAQDLMLSITRMCAFMEYRMDSIEEKKKFAAQGCKQFIFNGANTWAQEMSDALANKDAKKVVRITTRLKNDVMLKANMFTLIDEQEDRIKELLIALSLVS